MRVEEAKEELKRADHLIFVSLKYTRTMDVLESTVKRLITSLGYCVDSLLHVLLKSKKIKEIPLTYKNKVEVVRKHFSKDKTILELLRFYSFLIRVDRAKHERKSEFRKGVAMVVVDDLGGVIDDINIEKLKDYYLKTYELVEYVDEYLHKKK